MDGSRFDTWTRRKFGLAAGGAALAGLLGLAGLDDAAAARRRRRRRKGKRKPKPQRCRRLGQTCDSSIRRLTCCSNRHLCANVRDLGSGNFCCLQAGEFCDSHADCCGNDTCDFNNGRCRIPN